MDAFVQNAEPDVQSQPVLNFLCTCLNQTPEAAPLVTPSPATLVILTLLEAGEVCQTGLQVYCGTVAV